MSLFLKQFSTHAEYDAYINGSDAILPNVSICTTEGDVHYNPYVEPAETRVVAKFNVTSTSSPTPISFKDRYYDGISGFSAIEIDGVEQPSVITAYTFSTLGEHTVKYTLKKPTRLGQRAFYQCTGLTSIYIPNSVTSIGGEAFRECSGLTNVIIPDSVTTIGDSAFASCSGITSIVIPDSITMIYSYAFQNCSNLTSVIIGSGVTSIQPWTFANCSGLTSLNLPNSILDIFGYAFKDCSSLTSVVIPNSVTKIDKGAFNGCSGLTSIDIPSGVTRIDTDAFRNCGSLTSIVSNATTAPTIKSSTFQDVKTGGTLTVPSGSSGYDTWMQNANYYLGLYNWTKVEQ